MASAEPEGFRGDAASITFDGEEQGDGKHGASGPPDRGLCRLGDGQPAVGGGFPVCALHKKVIDNVYNDTKKQTGGEGEEWEHFKQKKRRNGPTSMLQ